MTAIHQTDPAGEVRDPEPGRLAVGETFGYGEGRINWGETLFPRMLKPDPSVKAVTHMMRAPIGRSTPAPVAVIVPWLPGPT